MVLCLCATFRNVMMLSVTTVQNWKFRISPHADWKQNSAEKPDRRIRDRENKFFIRTISYSKKRTGWLPLR